MLSGASTSHNGSSDLVMRIWKSGCMGLGTMMYADLWFSDASLKQP
jgi:hypothetical protein